VANMHIVDATCKVFRMCRVFRSVMRRWRKMRGSHARNESVRSPMKQSAFGKAVERKHPQVGLVVSYACPENARPEDSAGDA
jgi:hypothetical protein